MCVRQLSTWRQRDFTTSCIRDRMFSESRFYVFVHFICVFKSKYFSSIYLLPKKVGVFWWCFFCLRPIRCKFWILTDRSQLRFLLLFVSESNYHMDVAWSSQFIYVTKSPDKFTITVARKNKTIKQINNMFTRIITKRTRPVISSLTRITSARNSR